ncbi:unnamed protein product [Rhizoctonia solani]|uniref:Uncharacterized protein n=1 Tax=Rhizoctonia solani TaxID=456999 RepID=A0A8H3I2L8_9AGAM|nr:unnamed protein product [Rhizoctonia solani]
MPRVQHVDPNSNPTSTCPCPTSVKSAPPGLRLPSLPQIMHSIDLFPVHTFDSSKSSASNDDSASSEGVPTPLEGPQSHSNYPGQSPLSINIPNKLSPPLLGTPFITDSASLFEYPFPPVSSRPPLSSASSSSSVTSIPGPPSSATQDKHSSHVLVRLSSRVGPPGHRRTSSHGGLSPIPIPPRLRKLSGNHIFEESTPTQHDVPTPRFDLSPRLDSQSSDLPGEVKSLPSRDTVAVRPNYSLQIRNHSSARTIPGHELGPALSSTPRACLDIPIASRRRSMPAVLVDSDDEHGYASANEGLTRLRI